MFQRWHTHPCAACADETLPAPLLQRLTAELESEVQRENSLQAKYKDLFARKQQLLAAQ